MFINTLLFKKFYEYILEIKKRILYSCLSLIITFVIIFYYKDVTVFLLTKYLLYNMTSHRFIFTEVTSMFFVYIKYCFLVSFFFNMPFILFHLLFFFFNSLYLHELKIWFYIILALNILYIISILIIYFLIFPGILEFFLIFERNNIYFPLHFEAKLDRFLSFLFTIYTSIIFCFEMPVILYILKYTKIIDLIFIIKKRKVFYFSFLIISALISSPEIINQLFILLLLIFLYEFWVFLFLFNKNI